MKKSSLIFQSILDWYDQYKRQLPWRSDAPNPYHIWLSEIMLQQTTVPTVIPYFLRFIEKWPTLEALACASLDSILVEWQGLGYYSRARNLHKCAQYIQTNLKGHFPQSATMLQSLPGIGSYTSAAIASIAFNQPTAVVDGNIVRVLSRLYAIETPYPASKSQILEIATQLTPTHRPGDYAQALMDLGAMICKPQNPRCTLCPLLNQCEAYRQDAPSRYPIKEPKEEKPIRYTTAFLIQNQDEQIFLRRRNEKGLLGGMMEVPTGSWETKEKPFNESLSHALLSSLLPPFHLMGEIRHTFTHFHLKVKIFKTVVHHASLQGAWIHERDLHTQALPTLMKKIIRKGLKQ